MCTQIYHQWNIVFNIVMNYLPHIMKTIKNNYFNFK